MKTTHIIAIIVIALGIAIVMSTAGNASSYVDFKEAFERAEDGNETKVHVIGELTKNTAGEVIGVMYDPQVNPNYMEFTMIDDKQVTHKVACINPPASMQDFYKSEKVVVIGKVVEKKQGKQFVASEVLMKCPSKYEEKEIK